MSIQSFKFIPADDITTAEEALKENSGQSTVIAGGTDLLGVLKDSIHKDSPQLLIGLKSVKVLNYVKVEPGSVRIGALTTLDEIAKNPAIQKTFPLLAQSAASVASPQIRNVATIAGNLCQEPRCWYYRNPNNSFNCLRKGGRWCDALFAENRYHSIFGGMCVNAAPCETGCPIHNDIPAYMAKLREGKLEEAVEILLRTNPLAAIMGRACSHYCEEECNRFDYDEPVSIRDVERYLGDFALKHIEDFYQMPGIETGMNVAVVGSGPAGLTAAYFLRKQGHSVTIFEQMNEAGGMLRYSIPAYRLPKNVVEVQIRALKQMGIQFKLGIKIGENGFTLQDLRSRFQGVFLATGLWNGKNLKLEKAELLDSGLDFLFDIQKGVARQVGERVLVIGGGSVAVDVAITAKRSGARQVTMVCLETLDTMPAIPEDKEQAHEEEISILPSWGPLSVLTREGKLFGIELLRCTSTFDKEGRFAPVFDPDVKKIIEADQVFVAIGQSADLTYSRSSLITERGLIKTERGRSETNLDGVFAGGDVIGEVATVVKAMASGKRAAIAINEYLLRTRMSSEITHTGLKKLIINKAALVTSSRIEAPRLPVSQRTLRMEDSSTLTREKMDGEALRCANCGCVAVNCSDLAPALIALNSKIKTTKRVLLAEDLFAAAEKKSTVLDDNELIEEILIPTPNPENRQRYLKFRIRNSIDFPIVSVAFYATMRENRFHEARLVLGAVAPIPLRIHSVENLLEGQLLDEILENEAANLAVKNAQTLGRNKAKVEIVKALIKKSIQAN